MNKVPFGRATLGMNIVYLYKISQGDYRLLLLSCFDTRGKVEKILKGRLDSIPSPSQGHHDW